MDRLTHRNPSRPFHWITDTFYWKCPIAAVKFFNWLNTAHATPPATIRSLVTHRPPSSTHLSPRQGDIHCVCYCCGENRCPVPREAHNTIPQDVQRDLRDYIPLGEENFRELALGWTNFEQQAKHILNRLRNEGRLPPRQTEEESSDDNCLSRNHNGSQHNKKSIQVSTHL